MKSFPFKKIDAFTMGLSAGNPCACVYLQNPSDITENEMQRIAAELAGFVNEVIYLFPEKDCFFLKYYSAECAVDFCGHGTIGIMYDYILNNAALRNQAIVKIRVKNEYLDVYNKIKDNDCVYITAPQPQYLKLDLPQDEIAAALRISTDEINEKFPLSVINAGLNTLIVPITSLASCLAVWPDQSQLRSFCLANVLDIILIFSDQVSDRKNQFRTRVFAPKYGYLEDPATGSGNSAFGYYLLSNKFWDGAGISIEQNMSRDFPNIVKLDTVKKDNRTNVIFGGSAITRIDGVYKLG